MPRWNVVQPHRSRQHDLLAHSFPGVLHDCACIAVGIVLGNGREKNICPTKLKLDRIFASSARLLSCTWLAFISPQSGGQPTLHSSKLGPCGRVPQLTLSYRAQVVLRLRMEDVAATRVVPMAYSSTFVSNSRMLEASTVCTARFMNELCLVIISVRRLIPEGVCHAKGPSVLSMHCAPGCRLLVARGCRALRIPRKLAVHRR